MKNGHSAFLVFLNKDHVSAYKKYKIYFIMFIYVFTTLYIKMLHHLSYLVPAGCAQLCQH